MTREAVLDLLLEAGRRDGDSSVLFAEERQAALLVALDGTLVTVERLSRVVVKGGHVVAHGAREQLVVPTEHVMGLRLATEGANTGFRA